MGLTTCAIYARYSSEKQNSLTIGQQIRKCREYADRHNLVVADDYIFADEAVSGATDDRVGLQRLLALAQLQPRAFDVILVDDTSRLSRKLVDSLKIFERLQFIGVRVVFVAQGIDTSSEQAELLVATHGIVDSLYLKDLAKRTFRGVEQRALDGLHTGGRVFGYHHIPIEDPHERDSHQRPLIRGVKLEVDPEQAGTIRRIFARYSAGHSMKRIAIDLNLEGIPSPQPQKGRISQSWCQSSIHHILKNERYRGVVVWGKTRKLRSAETGKRIYRRTTESEWRRTVIPSQRIISDELWESVQARKRMMHHLYGEGAKNGIRAGRAAGSPYLFSGLLRCSLCGGSITMVSGTARNREGSRYGCSLHASRGDTVCRNNLLISRRLLEEGLLAGLQESALRSEVAEYTLKQFEKKLQQMASISENSIVGLERRRSHIEGKIANCTAAIADGQPSKFLVAKLADLERELDGVNEQIETARSGGAKSQLRETRTFVNERLRNLRKLLNGEAKIARAAISKHVQKIILTPEGRSYVATGEWDLFGAEKCGD